MITNFLMVEELPGESRIRYFTKNPRITSIDALRGIIMIIMALDHVRDYFHINAFTDSPTNLATTTPILFFTRWITHFCAPIFIFLAGTSAFISGSTKSKGELSTFLIKRGVWMLFVEILIINLAISFDWHYRSLLLQTLWAIGWSMIILGILVRTNYYIILVLGIMLITGHNGLDYLPKATPRVQLWMDVLLQSKWTIIPIGETRTALVAYAILPWTGVMLIGYAFGRLFVHFDSSHRKRILGWSGVAALSLFFVLRTINEYGDPLPWTIERNQVITLLSFFNVSKYPPSLQYILLTCGVALLTLRYLENRSGKVIDFVMVYGKVPMFYYIIHFYLIHLLCVIFFFASGHSMNEAFDSGSPLLMYFRPVNFGVGLGWVYLVWLAVILILYKPCKWFGTYKRENRHWWLGYL